MTLFYPKHRFLGAALLTFCLLLSTLAFAQQLTIAPFSTTLEAECATVGDAWTTERDSSASGREYITSAGNTSYIAAPPPDSARYRVSFTVDIPDANDFYLSARVNGTSANSDSYWVRINGGAWIKWDTGFPKDSFAYATVPGAPYSLASGETEIEFAIREAGTQLDKITLTTTKFPPEGIGPRGDNCEGEVDCEQFPESCKTSFYAEAECGQSGSGWRAVNNRNASNRRYLTYGGQPQLTVPPTNPLFERELQFKLDFAEGGEYTMYFLMNTPDNGKNSFWVRVDRQPWVEFVNETDGNQLATNGFEWRPVTTGSTIATFNLTAGKHIITVVNREPGAQIDKVFISNTAVVPVGKDQASDNCREDQIVGVRPDLDLSARMEVFPNPATRQLNFALSNDSRGQVAVMVYDINGRLITERRLRKNDTELRDALEVSQLAPGLYQLVLVTESGLISRTFVR